jgi:RimJ/RimL family protein N-acetyltransferase
MKVTLTSSNLTLRPSVVKDCAIFSLWEAKSYVNAFFTMNYSRDYEEILKEFILRDEEPSSFQFTIVHNESNKPIGRIYLSKYDLHEDSIDITRIYIGEDEYLRKGYGREAILLLLEYFYCTLKLERVTIDFFEENIRARTLYQSIGFKSEGVMRHISKKNNQYINLHLMSMLSDEYFSNYDKDRTINK